MISTVKVTTQRTNKLAKVLMLVGVLCALVGVYGLMTDANWSVSIFFLGLFLWVAGKLFSWWFNE